MKAILLLLAFLALPARAEVLTCANIAEFAAQVAIFYRDAGIPHQQYLTVLNEALSDGLADGSLETLNDAALFIAVAERVYASKLSAVELRRHVMKHCGEGLTPRDRMEMRAL